MKVNDPLVEVKFNITQKSLRELEQMAERSGLPSIAPLLDNMVNLYEWALTQAENGRVIASVDDVNKSFREVSLPVLDEVRKRNM